MALTPAFPSRAAPPKAPAAPPRTADDRREAAAESLRLGMEALVAAESARSAHYGELTKESATTARYHFEAALALVPGLPEGTLGLARAYRLAGAPDPDVWNPGAPELIEAAALYDTYLAAKPADVVVRMETARLAVQRRDLRRARIEIERVLAADVDGPGALPADARAILARDYVELCPDWTDLDDIDLVREGLARAARAAPGDDDCSFALARVTHYDGVRLRAIGEDAASEAALDRAEAAYRLLVAAGGSVTATVRRVGALVDLLRDRSELRAAKKVLVEARGRIERGADDDDLKRVDSLLGLICYDLKDWTCAEAAWRRAFEIHRDAMPRSLPTPASPAGPDAESGNNLAWVLATAADPAVYDPEEAISIAKDVVLATRWLKGAYIDTLAEAYFGVGDYATALATIERAIALGPADEYHGEYVARREKYLAAMSHRVSAGAARTERWWSHRPTKD